MAVLMIMLMPEYEPVYMLVLSVVFKPNKISLLNIFSCFDGFHV